VATFAVVTTVVLSLVVRARREACLAQREPGGTELLLGRARASLPVTSICTYRFKAILDVVLRVISGAILGAILGAIRFEFEFRFFCFVFVFVFVFVCREGPFVADNV
jgi:hypothetical protein